MHVAAMTGQIKVFQTMLEKAVDKDPKDDNWDTPLHSAARGGHYTICKLIFDAGIEDKNPINENFETPLELATLNNHTKVGLLILESVGSLILYWKNGIFPDQYSQLKKQRKRRHTNLESDDSLIPYWKNRIFSDKYNPLMKQRKRRHTN